MHVDDHALGVHVEPQLGAGGVRVAQVAAVRRVELIGVVGDATHEGLRLLIRPDREADAGQVAGQTASRH
jgi:hypothetical protein